MTKLYAVGIVDVEETGHEQRGEPKEEGSVEMGYVTNVCAGYDQDEDHAFRMVSSRGRPDCLCWSATWIADLQRFIAHMIRNYTSITSIAPPKSSSSSSSADPFS